MLTTQGKHLPGRRRSHQGLLCQKSAPLGLARCLSGVRLGLWPSPAHCLLQSPCLCQGQSLTVPSEQASLHFHDGTNFEMGKWHRRPQSPFTCRQQATATNGLGATPTAMPGTTPQARPVRPQHLPGCLLPGPVTQTCTDGARGSRHAGAVVPLPQLRDYRPATHLPSAPRAQHPEILMPG